MLILRTLAHRARFICFLVFVLTLWNHTEVCARSLPVTFRPWGYAYVPTAIDVAGQRHAVEGLIDTGASYCLIDSAFAVTVCRVDLRGANTIRVRAAGGARIEVRMFEADSVRLGAAAYGGVKCLVVDLRGKFREFAPDFIIGANVLKQTVWCFDLKNNCMMPAADVPSTVRTKWKLKWKSHESYEDAFLDGIYLSGKIGGKNVRLLLDTGSRFNQCPAAYLDSAAFVSGVAMRGDIGSALRVRKIYRCNGVAVRVGGLARALDFVVEEGKAVLNWDFLRGDVFVLDYGRKEIRILQ